MKKYFILAALLCCSSILLFSQDKIDPPKLSQFDTSPVVDKNFNGFIIGWNWGTPGAMLDSAMYIFGAGDWGLETGNQELGIWN